MNTKTPDTPSPFHNETTLDNLIEGNANRAALSLARRIARQAGCESVNPFVLIGESGTGKTAILKALAKDMSRGRPEAALLYTTGPILLNTYIEALQNDKLPQFREQIARVDLLLLDECERLFNHPTFNGELRTLLDNLLEDGKQVVVASACPFDMDSSHDVEKGLWNRLRGGVVVELKRPDEELCRRLTEQKLKETKIKFPTETADFVAKTMQGRNFWELLGGIHRLMVEPDSAYGDMPQDRRI